MLKVKMKENETHFRLLMLFVFIKKDMRRNEGSDIAESNVHKWFARFRGGNIDQDDREHSGRPLVIEDDQIETLIKSNLGHTKSDISHMSVVRHLKILGYLNLHVRWVPFDMTGNLKGRISIFDYLLKGNKSQPFKKNKGSQAMKKRIFCNNVERKHSFRKRIEPLLSTSKASLHPMR